MTDLVVPGDAAVRIHRTADQAGPLPALLYLYGGAYVMGGLDDVEASARLTADQAGVVVVTVDYRPAPENPYPAGLEDRHAAFTWLAEAGGDHGVDTARIGVLGESAGGGRMIDDRIAALRRLLHGAP